MKTRFVPRCILALLALALIVPLAACGRESPTQPSGGPPVIALFTVDPDRLSATQRATVRWEVLDSAAQVRIDPLPGNVATVGTYTFTPQATTHLVISARNSHGTTQRFVTVTVTNGSASAGLF